MQIRVGYELSYEFQQPTPVILALNVHYTRASDLVRPDHHGHQPVGPDCRVSGHVRQLVQPGRRARGSGALLGRHRGERRRRARPGRARRDAASRRVRCRRRRWSSCWESLLRDRSLHRDRVGSVRPDAARGGDVCRPFAISFISHITFGYEHASATKTAWDVYNDARGVCRDYAHLAITLCRCMNIPARYCTGYLGDIGLPPPYGPMDFAGWFDAYLGGQWYTFDARNNVPRIGRVLIAQRPRRSRRGDHDDVRPEQARELPRLDRPGVDRTRTEAAAPRAAGRLPIVG